MQLRSCEVIGCRVPAVWERRTQDGTDSEFLCGPHYNELRLRTPDESSRFRPIASMPLNSAVVAARASEPADAAIPH